MQFSMSGEPHPTTLTITYEHSSDFAVKYADGATVKSMPSGNIYVGFFLERPHEFESVVHELTPAGGFGKEKERTIRDGVCRELQSGLVVNPAAARVIAKLLLDILEKVETQNAAAGPAKETPHDT